MDCGRIKNLTGKRFGKLVASKCVGKDRHNNAVWLCRCDCGREKTVASRSLVSGNTRSCGCLETGRFINGLGGKRHGGSNERLYRVWGGMRNRCYDENRPEYPNYGGRGIRVCDEWLHDYAAFRKWAYENGFDPDLSGYECSIDRIDVNGDYRPDNCRWIPMSEQGWNTRRIGMIEYRGEPMTLVEASGLYGIAAKTIKGRLKRGWPVERAVETPARKLSNGNVSTVCRPFKGDIFAAMPYEPRMVTIVPLGAPPPLGGRSHPRA